jgi:hypothetical protein
MPLAMLLTLLGVGLSLVMVSVLTNQTAGTRSEVERSNAVNAAQSGLDAAMVALRSSTRTGHPNSGDVSLLPCNVLPGTGALAGSGVQYAVTGKVSGGGDAAYGARIFYLDKRPPPGNGAHAIANQLPCRPALDKLAYAMIISTGTDGPSTQRTLTATYSFTTTFQNTMLSGGKIRLFARDDQPANLCLAAKGLTANSGVHIDTCSAADDDPYQLFSYEANLNLTLKNTYPRLCLDGGSTMVAGVPLLLKPCATTTVAWQQWESNDYSAFTLARPDSTSICMAAEVGGTDVRMFENVTAAQPCQFEWSHRSSFSIDPAVGSGRAGSETGQLVNLKEFSRCIDVTGNDPSKEFLVVYPCKQKIGGDVLWNQRWNLPAVPPDESSVAGPIWTTVDEPGNDDDGKTFCLTSPGTTAAGSYITVTECAPAGAQTEPVTWIVYSDTGRTSTSYRIETAYNMVNNKNFCMAPDPADEWKGGEEEDFNLRIHKLRLAVCDGSELQKWNASTTTRHSPLQDIVEK